MIELSGRRVVPGFNDAHVHFSTGGFSLESVQLRDARSEEEFRERIRRFAATRPKGEWILRGEWDPEGWRPAGAPTRATIDDVTPDNPVFISRTDAHTMLANTLAMRLAGVDRDTTEPSGGVVERDVNGAPNGIFKDAANSLIARAVPRPTLGEVVAAVDAAQRHAARHGITSVQDMGILSGDAEDRANLFRAYQRLLRGGRLRVRVSLHFPLSSWRDLARLGISAGFGSSKLQIGALKAFADGSLGSRTARFVEAYSDDPHSRGLWNEGFDSDRLFDEMLQADEAGLQLAIHAIGDHANGRVLDLYERLVKENGARDRRLRIEHAQHVLLSDVSRFAALGVIASVQPYHCIDDGRWAEQRIGPARSRSAFGFGSLAGAGAVLALGSDWFVGPIDPLKAIFAAVTRRTLDGEHPGGWNPDQKLTVTQAVHAYTTGSAYASYQEHVKGSLEAGKVADLAVLSDDIFRIEPAAIRDVAVEMTIFDGNVVYERQ
jgi:predicted amidohydrolase YtcJ